MSKLNNFRDEKAYNYGWIEKVSKFTSKVLTVYLANSSEKDFKKGWDAHEALNLPVLFAEWKEVNKITMYGYPHYCFGGASIDYLKLKNNEELYDYWMNNIYKT